MYKKSIWISILVCCLLVGCKRVGPQRPTQRSGQEQTADTAALAMLEMHRQMVEEADRLVAQWAKAQEQPYALMEWSNCWVQTVVRGDEDSPAPKNGEHWTMHIKTRNLEGKLYSDVEKEYTIGQNELPSCIEIHILERRHGDSLVIAAPWYTAYGFSGNGAIPQYANVVMEVKVE